MEAIVTVIVIVAVLFLCAILWLAWGAGKASGRWEE